MLHLTFEFAELYESHMSCLLLPHVYALVHFALSNEILIKHNTVFDCDTTKCQEA